MSTGNRARIGVAMLMLMVSACTPVQQDRSASSVRHAFALPAQQAGECFARNAEAHSSALVAEVRPPDARGHVQVIVRVKNGVTYATADLQPVGQRANGTIALNVISSAGTSELVRSLVEGC